ncbi:MAG: hypothetical protein JEZ06_24430 [Anaerolineaceae bacterium]|nr:hypothetical protein [Anaerolineaceae bacterium]
MIQSKNMLVWGTSLIALGVLFFLNVFFKSGWALPIVGVGLVFLVVAIVFRMGAFAIPGVIILGMGVLLFTQSITHNWVSWLYVWPLVPGFVGLGLLLANWMGMGKQKVRRIGLAFLGSSVVMIVLCWFGYTMVPWFSWAWILMGMGLIFFSVSVFGRAGGFAIPGSILAIIGMLLFWQNLTGRWATWNYLWPLVILSVGLGLYLMGVLGAKSHKAPRQVGIEMMVWSVIFLIIFAVFFMEGGLYITYWPIILIGSGMYMIVRTFVKQAREKRTQLNA